MPKLVYYISHTNIFNNAINNYIPICDDLISFEVAEKKMTEGIVHTVILSVLMKWGRRSSSGSKSQY